MEAFLDDVRAALREIGGLTEAWRIYLCATPPDGQSGVDSGECACKLCILDPRSVALADSTGRRVFVAASGELSGLVAACRVMAAGPLF